MGFSIKMIFVLDGRGMLPDITMRRKKESSTGEIQSNSVLCPSDFWAHDVLDRTDRRA